MPPKKLRATGNMNSSEHTAGNLADPSLLSKIDKLFACGVGEYIALPQLVVVGDQSSGKSSVLEGLTNLPFPRDSGLCTRFATQIIFQRSQESNISVSIIAAPGASQEHVEATKEWKKTNLKTLDQTSFSEIMKEVHMVMGLGEQQNAAGKATFSEDVLKLEVSGPDQEHFSVVDVPGIFRKTTEGVTTKTDLRIVETMVRGYMENPRSVMLTVIPSNVDIATQDILTMAEDVDGDGYRTLGVLTKPDLVDDETPLMELIEGRRHKLNLGWCMVRNPSQKQLNDPNNDRYAIEEDFFRIVAPWNSLPKDRVGVKALRIRLQEILGAHIRREFPKVKSEIHKKLTAAKQSLDKLGTKRETTDEQRAYLSDISMHFQEIAALALNGNYVGNDWFDQFPTLKYANAVMTRNELFNNILEQYGQSYGFTAAESDTTEEVAVPPPALPEYFQGSAEELEEPEEQLILRTTESHAELEEVMFKTDTTSKRIGHDIVKWLTKVYKGSRGFELGTFDSSLLAMTMKAQSSKWEEIALAYISDVVTMAHTFIVDLLRLVCPSLRVREGLMSILMDDLMAKYKTAFDSARLLLRLERMGTPITLNHYFNDNLEKSRQRRMRAAMEKKSVNDCQHGVVVRLDDIMQHHPMSNTEHTVRDIHDILQSYYKVARKRFVDNMCMQASDYHLVTGPGTPLKLFSPSFVSGLSPEQLEEVAREDTSLKRMRKYLDKQIKDLEAGKKILT